MGRIDVWVRTHDLGMASNPVPRVRWANQPGCHPIHTRGSGREVFTCLNHVGVSEAARPLIGEPLAYEDDSMHQEIAKKNIGIRWPREERE